MKLLVTAGNTQTPIDRVRCITNLFTGTTGARIATTAHERGHSVVFLTSHPEVLEKIPLHRERAAPDWETRTYRTFDELESLMERTITSSCFDVIIHAAAVSDYQLVGTFARQGGEFIDVSAGKVKSHHEDLWLRLNPTAKLVDKIRTDWGHAGTLVKFKLEVGLSEAELLEVAERSRQQSSADWMVANTLEGMQQWAFIGNDSVGYVQVTRTELAETLLQYVERFSPLRHSLEMDNSRGNHSIIRD